MEEIELKELFLILRKRMWIILLITTLALATSGVVNYYVLEPEYQTFTTLMVGRPQDYEEKLEYSDILLSQRLVTTYGEIAKSRVVSREVIENLNLNLTPEQLRQKVNVSSVKDTEIIKITVNDKNPQTAEKISNEIAAVFMKHVSRIMKIENVQVIDRAEVPKNPVKPKHMLNMAISGVLGIMISVFLVFFLEYFDNTVKTPNDIEQYIGLPVIGMIPKNDF